jgi:dTDP-6-deoxy-L-talose 4-dehydrogenase (NAD+)
MHECGYWEGAITADTPCNPSSKYGISKNAMRQAVLLLAQEYNVDCKWLRAYYITGDEAAGQSLFSRIVAWEKEGKATFPFTTGRCKYDLIDISTLAYQIMRASVQSKISGIINVCSGVPVALRDRVEAFLAERKYAIRPEYGAFPERPYDSPCVYGDPTLINQILAESE